MNKQPEALRLVETPFSLRDGRWNFDADDELRRLHALVEEMGKAFKGLERFVREADEEDGSVFGWGAINADEGKAARTALTNWKESK